MVFKQIKIKQKLVNEVQKVTTLINLFTKMTQQIFLTNSDVIKKQTRINKYWAQRATVHPRKETNRL